MALPAVLGRETLPKTTKANSAAAARPVAAVEIRKFLPKRGFFSSLRTWDMMRAVRSTGG